MKAVNRLFLLVVYWSIVLIACGYGWDKQDIIDAEVTFRMHRRQFVTLAEAAVVQYRDRRDGFRLSSSDFYDYAWISDADWRVDDENNLDRDMITGTPRGVIAATVPEHIYIEFVLENFYVPIVYIASDQPIVICNTCSAGGSVMRQLEPNWYICVRDWN